MFDTYVDNVRLIVEIVFRIIVLVTRKYIIVVNIYNNYRNLTHLVPPGPLGSFGRGLLVVRTGSWAMMVM